MMDNEELLASFIEESQQHLQTIEPDLLEVEEKGDNVDQETINRVFRSIHSIKGAAGFFGLQKINELSHVMENLLSLLRDRKISVSAEFIDTMLSSVDTLRAMVDDVGSSEDFDIQEDKTRLQNLLEKLSSGQMEEKSKSVKKKDKNGFTVSENKLKSVSSKGQFLYEVKMLLNDDLDIIGKTPLEYIENINLLGQVIDSQVNIGKITGLKDCLENDIEISFAFATVLEPDLTPTGLELDEEKVNYIKIEDIQKEPEKEEKAELPAPVEKQEETPEEKSEVPKTEQPEPPKQQKNSAKQTKQVQADEKIRVSVSYLNELVNLAGELVLGRNQLMQITDSLLKDAPGLNTVLQHISRVTSEMQEKIMNLRMQPVSVIFTKFHRIVRDLARNLKKEIVLETYGEEVELDKSIIESLSDPLTHIIRNSADHAIELPEEREAAGKSHHGTIVLKAYHQGGQVHLDISDDGKGIDSRFIAEKSIEKGIITKEELDSMSEKDMVRLILKPGFSTAKKISSVSGRGVGMDVVLTNIEQLGGTVDIETVLGQGTKISLILPLTLAIVSGLVIKIDANRFILPEANIEEMVRIKPEEVKKRIDSIQDAKVLRLRNMLLPLVHLKDALGISENILELKNIKMTNEPLRILILKNANTRFGLVVDSVENIEEIVVKPLPKYLKKIQCFSGATIMGNGTVALILDVAGIVEQSDLQNIEEQIQEVSVESKDKSVSSDIQTLLLFDNGTPEQFAIPLELITRIEKVPIENIEIIKNDKFFQYQGENLKLLYLENYLPVNPPDREENDSIGVLVPKLQKHPMGIVINRVIDTISAEVELDTTTKMAPGLFGTAVLNKKITLLPDMYKLFEMAAPEWYDIDNSQSNKTDQKTRILLVEDTPFFRMIETEYLESAGYEVITAENGAKALQILEEQAFDAIILDIIMPDLDGWEVIKVLREDERWKTIPVMAVTSLGDERNRKKGMQAGFTEWEGKLNKTRLLEKLNKILAKQEENVS